MSYWTGRTYKSPFKKLLVVEIDDVWKAGHALDPLSEIQAAIAVGAVDKKDSNTPFTLGC